MKNCILFTILIFVSTLLYSQPDPVFSQSMFNIMAINPAYAGSSEKLCVNMLNRKDLIGLPDLSPMVLGFNANMPFKLFGRSHGIGLSVIQDGGLDFKLGFSSASAVNLNYAYKIDVGSGKLAIGFNGGFYNYVMTSPEWIDTDGTDGTGDNYIPKTNEDQNSFSFDLGIGLFYKSENLYAGFSGLHLNTPKLFRETEFKKIEKITNSRHFYITTGYDIQLTNPLLVFKPSILINSGGSLSKLDINSIFEYNKKVWFGVSYKTGVTFVGIFGVEIQGARVGFSYDLGTNSLNGLKYGKGSYELLINACFDLKVEKKPQQYKSIRFL